jgi:hypothetical protein
MQPDYQQLLSDDSLLISVILKIRVAGRCLNAVNDIAHFTGDVANGPV